jgi:mono/diheme cytochrome c family protein
MRNTFTILALVILVWGCAKKMTPGQSQTPASNSGSAMQTPSQNNTEKQATGTAPATTTTAPTAAVGGPAGTLASTPKPEDAPLIAGQQTYNAKCGRCHGLKVTTEFTADRWMSIMAVMSIKANLNQTERDNVTAYVRANSKK